MQIRKEFEGDAVIGTVEVGEHEYEVSWTVGAVRADVLGRVEWNGRRHVTVPCELQFLLVDDETAEELQYQLEDQRIREYEERANALPRTRSEHLAWEVGRD